jgi:hypothetical protein
MISPWILLPARLATMINEVMSDSSSAISPILPRTHLRVGVSGHRLPPKLPSEAMAGVRVSVDSLLSRIADATHQVASELSGKPAELTIVSALAEGSDRIVAEAGLAAGYSLQAILPFVRSEYLRDFGSSPASAGAFSDLLERSFSVFEIDGDASERPRAYEAAGIVMLANVDLLIAIWDGDVAGGIGGTADVVSRAIADGIPVVQINPANPTGLQLSWSQSGSLTLANALPRDTFRDATVEDLRSCMRDILLPPPGQMVTGALGKFLAEKVRKWTFCPWYPLLLLLFSGRPFGHKDFHIASALSDTREKWQRNFKALPKDRSQQPVIEAVLLPAYLSADTFAIFYANVYRSAYIFNFLFAAIAVFLALGGIFVHSPKLKSVLVTAELVIISAVLITWLVGQWRQWHRRWLEYRRLAESIRQMRVLAAIGLRGPIDRPGPGIDERDWGSWYAWSIRRLLPLPDRTIDKAYLSSIRDVARSAEISSQIRYHTNNAALFEKINHRMHRCGQFLFALTALLCALFVVSVWLLDFPAENYPQKDHVLEAFTFLTAFLPMLGATLTAINVQGEFKIVFEQSKRSVRRLATIDRVLQDEDLSFGRLCDRLEKASDIMMADVDEWQNVFRSRPLSLPA